MYNPQLETFLHVADAGSFNKAAELLYITPTAVIKQMNLLESTLCVKLFERTHRGLILTPAGKSFYQDTKYIIQYCKDSMTRAKNAMQEDGNIIRIGVSPMTPTQFLLELWPKIHELCPELKFHMVNYENSAENAREILNNFGTNIDIVGGLYDGTFLEIYHCAALELDRMPIRCAVPLNHPLAQKTVLSIEDLHGQRFMLIRRGWNHYLDVLRDELWLEHPEITIVDFERFNLNVFNQCEAENNVLMSIDPWENVHPMLKSIPVNWNHTIPYGILHAPQPSNTVSRFLSAVQTAIQK